MFKYFPENSTNLKRELELKVNHISIDLNYFFYYLPFFVLFTFHFILSTFLLWKTINTIKNIFLISKIFSLKD